MKNFPYSEAPSGWYQVAWSQEVERGQTLSMTCFNEDLVCYRDEEGAVHVIDAYCPHMGAHLGVGGRVEGSDIVCPFHGWRFDAEGCNIDIPYSVQVQRHRRLRTWTVHEVSELILVWYDSQGAPAQLEQLPVFPENFEQVFVPAHPSGTRVERVGVVPQQVVENTVDLAHLVYVHGWMDQPRIAKYGADGPRFRCELVGAVPSREGPVDIQDDIDISGPSLVLASQRYRFGGRAWQPNYDAMVLIAVTPVFTEESGRAIESDLRVTVWVNRENAQDREGTAFGQAADLIRASFREVFDHDAPIWESTRYVRNPPLTREEGKPASDARRWMKQFYPSGMKQAVASAPAVGGSAR